MTGEKLNLTGFRLTFDDEFNAFSSNGPSNPYDTGHTGTWDTTYSYGERKLNDEAQWYSDPTTGTNPFSVKAGVLSITAAPSTDLTASQGQLYTSGAITTFHSFSQQYGYFEMRAKLPEAIGMWPAFWMLPVQHVWPPELDPLEAFGSNGPSGEAGAYALHSGLVETGSGGQGAWYGTGGANLYTQYNTFGVDWEPDTITFYLNGTAYASTKTPSDFNQPMYLLANLAVGGNWAGAPIGQTASLDIDYIRAFARLGNNPAVAQQAISSPDGRGYNFYGALDAHGAAALGGKDAPAPAATLPAAGPAAPTGTQTVGSGPDVLALSMSEDAYLGDAQFLVTVDGVQRGGVLSTAASHAAGQTQLFRILGDFGPGQHRVGVNFINNYGSAPGADRNLFVVGATFNGTAIPGATLSQYVGGEQSFSFVSGPATDPSKLPVIMGAGPDSFVLNVSEQAWAGDATFVVAVDGVIIGGVQTATASHAAGQTQAFSVHGNFGSGPHAIDVSFLNDAYGGSSSADRNLYVDSLVRGGQTVTLDTPLLNQGTKRFNLPAVALFATAPASPLFDAAFYLAHNPDVAAAGVDPAWHYAQFGWREGRDPSALFHTRYYLNQNPDVAAAGINPLAHYETTGWKEGRDPSILFSTRAYLADNPDVAQAGVNPLAQYMTGGQAAGRAIFAATPHTTGAPNPLIDAATIYAQQPGVAADGLDPATWFYTTGWKLGVNPNASFDTNYYLRQNPDVAAAGIDPLLHYDQNGWREGRDPSLLFSTGKYLASNPDVAAARMDPLAHFRAYGAQEGRISPLAGGSRAADPLVDTAYYDKQLGATLIPTGAAGNMQAAASYDRTGWTMGLNPDAWFDTRYYLAHNPDVAAAHINPLLHYEASGWHEGRNPSAQFDTNRYLAANADVRNVGIDPLLHFVSSGQAEGRQAFAVLQ
ncbi:MAG: carbohydrate-binding domain-containing protein [Janthinobacterium lividum]